MSGATPVGTVYLIGAGPGDPGLITLRGAELLARCDVVLFDGLCNPELLARAPAAEHICVGKHGQSRIWQQSEIIEEMVRHARRGRAVARLKGGDPAIFARTSEEVAGLREAGIPFQIVPGITAALAAGSYAGIPVTDRRLASAVALITGHEEPGKSQSSLDWQALARFPGTLVVYMGVTTANAWTSALIGAGKPPDTPAALIRRCSFADQQTIHCRLDEVAQRLTPASKLRPPVIAIVGAVTTLAQSMSWMPTRPLLGKTVLVTRPAAQAPELAVPLRELGAEVIIEPMIEVGPPECYDEMDAAIENLDSFAGIVFSSRNGVRFFLDRLIELRGDVRALAPHCLAAVGSNTAEAIAEYHLRADVVPQDYHARSLVEALATDAANKHFLLIRASRGSDELVTGLAKAGAKTTELVAYQNRDVAEPHCGVAQRLADGRIDWVTVTSSATARNLHRLFGNDLKRARIATLSPVTTATLTELGYEVAAEANPYTMLALADAVARAAGES